MSNNNNFSNNQSNNNFNNNFSSNQNNNNNNNLNNNFSSNQNNNNFSSNQNNNMWNNNNNMWNNNNNNNNFNNNNNNNMWNNNNNYNNDYNNHSNWNNNNSENKSMPNNVWNTNSENNTKQNRPKKNEVKIGQCHDDSTHYGVTCDICYQNPIRGRRYKCIDCSNYDLCEYCYYSKGYNHGFHNYNCMTKIKSNSKVHSNTRCDGCDVFPVIGKRFKCSTCNNFDYCESCYNFNIEIHQHYFDEL